MNRVVWGDDAVDDLDGIIAYIDQFDPAAALRYRAALIDLADGLIDFPNRGRPAGNGLREMTSVPPYVLSYRVERAEVRIVEVRHGRRQPRR